MLVMCRATGKTTLLAGDSRWVEVSGTPRESSERIVMAWAIWPSGRRGRVMSRIEYAC